MNARAWTEESLEMKLIQAFPDLTSNGLQQFRKIAQGQTDIDGKLLARLGLVYCSDWKHNQWALTEEGLKFANKNTRPC